MAVKHHDGEKEIPINSSGTRIENHWELLISSDYYPPTLALPDRSSW